METHSHRNEKSFFILPTYSFVSLTERNFEKKQRINLPKIAVYLSARSSVNKKKINLMIYKSWLVETEYLSKAYSMAALFLS